MFQAAKNWYEFIVLILLHNLLLNSDKIIPLNFFFPKVLTFKWDDRNINSINIRIIFLYNKLTMEEKEGSIEEETPS